MESELKRAGIPPEYLAAKPDECRIMPDLLRWWRAGELVKGRGLLLMGPVGTGKSCTAALVARKAYESGYTVRWEYVPQLLDELASWDTRREAHSRASRHDLLVLDDFGVDKLTPGGAALLDRIVESRYSRARSMLVTTNLTAETLGSEDPLLARMVSRWRERCQGIVIGGDDRRKR